MPITNQGKTVNMAAIQECKNKYISFKNTMNGVVAPNAMRGKFVSYNPSCSTHIPTLGGKSRRNRKSRKHTRKNRNTRKH